jgi:hypothetical protein
VQAHGGKSSPGETRRRAGRHICRSEGHLSIPRKSHGAPGPEAPANARMAMAGVTPLAAARGFGDCCTSRNAAIDTDGIRPYMLLACKGIRMPWYDFIWNSEPGGNVSHIADHGIEIEDAEAIVCSPWPLGSAGRPAGRWQLESQRMAVGRWLFTSSSTVSRYA